MEIQFDVSIAGKSYSYQPGERADISQKQAIRLCEAGIAHPIKNKKTERQIKSTEEIQAKTYPHHKGGGYYVLSNGNEVRGKEKAKKAEKKIKE